MSRGGDDMTADKAGIQAQTGWGVDGLVGQIGQRKLESDRRTKGHSGQDRSDVQAVTVGA